MSDCIETVSSSLKVLFPHQEGAQYWFSTEAGQSAVVSAGLARRLPAESVTGQTTFHCFSATKPVTALAVLQLAMAGRVSLDAPLASYLADLPYQNGATVRQVLSHQAGLPNPLPLAWVHTEPEHVLFDAHAFLDGVLHDYSKCSPPGRRVQYSNIGFLLLGRLVEVVSQRPYEEYVKSQILEVVNCNGADGYLGFEIPEEHHATGYTRRWSGLGVFISMLPDQARLRVSEGGWIRYHPFHLNGAAYGGLKGNVLGWSRLLLAIAARDTALLSAEGYEAFFKPQVLESGKSTGHSLAWFTGECPGRGSDSGSAHHSYLCHPGGGPGYGAEIRIYPSLRAASALLTNTTIVSDKRLLDRLDACWLP